MLGISYIFGSPNRTGISRKNYIINQQDPGAARGTGRESTYGTFD